MRAPESGKVNYIGKKTKSGKPTFVLHGKVSGICFFFSTILICFDLVLFIQDPVYVTLLPLFVGLVCFLLFNIKI